MELLLENIREFLLEIRLERRNQEGLWGNLLKRGEEREEKGKGGKREEGDGIFPFAFFVCVLFSNFFFFFFIFLVKKRTKMLHKSLYFFYYSFHFFLSHPLFNREQEEKSGSFGTFVVKDIEVDIAEQQQDNNNFGTFVMKDAVDDDNNFGTFVMKDAGGGDDGNFGTFVMKDAGGGGGDDGNFGTFVMKDADSGGDNSNNFGTFVMNEVRRVRERVGERVNREVV